jgi:holo-[acyl-carrier protein] synthase
VLKENEILKTLDELTAAQTFAAGNDLVYIPAFRESFTDLFKNKVYRPGELAYCEKFTNPIERYASTWAAKEAVYKAVKQIDPSPLGPKNIEIIRSHTAGKPQVVVHKDGADYKISLTITHDGDYAWAIAFIDTRL